MLQVGDSDRLDEWVARVLEARPDEVARYGEGETKLLGFFMGEVMKTSGGRADPKRVRDVLRVRLG